MSGIAQVNRRLVEGKIVRMSLAQWQKVTGQFPLVEAVDTGLAGRILLVRRDLPGAGSATGWALVEEPTPAERIIRPLANEREARALIADRLAAYERMWDG